jgi:hypothetical protein
VAGLEDVNSRNLVSAVVRESVRAKVEFAYPPDVRIVPLHHFNKANSPVGEKLPD